MDTPKHEGWYWARRAGAEWEIIRLSYKHGRWWVSMVDEEVAGSPEWFEFGVRVDKPKDLG